MHVRRVNLNHVVLGRPLTGPYPPDTRIVWFGMGCFWGAEKLFWTLPGIHTTAVGYAGGHVIEPSYEQVCRGNTGHAEVVQVVYNPARVSFSDLLACFWENHDPTQGMRQGNDIGTQYRSAIFTSTAGQQKLALASKDAYQMVLRQAGFGEITTEIILFRLFYFAEDYHQQYLAKHPRAYCGLGGTGVPCQKPARQESVS